MTVIASDDKNTVTIVSCSPSVNLFGNDIFIKHQQEVQGKQVLNFTLNANATNTLIASQSFSRAHNSSLWHAPVTGAFSALEANEYISMADLEFFVDGILDYLFKNEGAEEIIWRLPPSYYDSKVNTKLQNILFRRNLKAKAFDLNFHLEVDSYEKFRDRLSSSKRRELNRITKQGVEFYEATTKELQKQVYDVIKKNRESQGYPMTMAWDSIDELSSCIGHKIKFFLLNRGDNILAGAICLQLTDSVLYVFYWGENPDFRKDSPIIKLAEGIFMYALQNNFSVMDIGTSTDSSEPNQGLISFKENIGCLVSSKMTLSLHKSDFKK